MDIIDSHFLRGTARIVVTATVGRLLENNSTNINSTNVYSNNNNVENSNNNDNGNGDNHGSNDNDSFLLFASVIVGLISLAYVVCMIQMFKMWFCRVCCGREFVLPDHAIIVHEGQILELNARQRRAVLEAIFSETSKVRSKRRNWQIF